MPSSVRTRKKAAIVLGGGLKKVQVGDEVRYEPEAQARERLDKAYALYEAGQVDTIITTGKISIMATIDPDVVGPQTEAEVSKAYLIAQARDAASPRSNIQGDIFYEAQSLDTIGNAWYAKKQCLEPLGITQCIVVTSDYHMERARAIFEWVLGPQYTVECAASPSHLSEDDRERRDQFERRLTEHMKTHLIASIPAGDDEALARFMENDHLKMFPGMGPGRAGMGPGFPRMDPQIPGPA